MLKHFAFCLVLLIPQLVISQSNALQFEENKLLPNTINSGADELMPLLTPDGETMYFVRSAHPDNIGGRLGNQDIWYSQKNNSGSWGKATSLTHFNNKGNNAVTGIHKDGQRIYLLNSYEDDLGTKSGLSYSDKIENEWALPVVTKIEGIYNINNSNDIYGLNVNAMSDVLLISMDGPNSMGKEDLYVSFKFTGWNRFHNANDYQGDKGKYWWSPPIHMGNTLNSTGYEISPFLSEDGSTLFFSSERKGGYGSADVYFSTRLDDSWTHWSTPTNLGRRINSKRFDAYFFLAPDSTVLFSSARSGKLAQIYASKLLKSPTDIVSARSELFKPKEKGYSQLQIGGPIMMASNQLQLNLMNSIDRNILFDHNSSNLLLKDLDILPNTVDILTTNTNLQVHLIGHTDQVGSHEKNIILAQRRAVIVKEHFIKKGIDPSRIIVAGVGEGNPIADNTDEKGRELNRRVELEFKFSN